jgi:uncharacterized protein (DUF58 family)
VSATAPDRVGRSGAPALLAALRRYRREPAAVAVSCFFGLACLGWALSALPLAIAGMLGACTTVALVLWQRLCLVGVTFRRHLSATRAEFGERVVLELELENDKLLPLPWLELEEAVPAALELAGVTVRPGGPRAVSGTLVQVRPLLPYQRVRRRVVVRCTRRGEHLFGPGRLRSGDPVGLRDRSAPAPGTLRLLVYPKRFALEPAELLSRVVLGDRRARRELVEDPSRVAGVRAYRPGDPLRRVDWRASARTSELLVREFDATHAPRAALIVDLALPGRSAWSGTPDEVEFVIAVAASLLAELHRLGVPAGLYVAGSVDGRPLVLPAGAGAGCGGGGLVPMLEGLAKVSDRAGVSFASLVAGESGRLGQGTSAIVLAAHVGESAAAALGELRRRHPVTLCLVETGDGTPPPPGSFDSLVRVRYEPDWERREVLELQR